MWDIRDGWADLLDCLLTDLEELGWRPDSVTCIKQKYGGLRFYVDDDLDDYLDEDEDEALDRFHKIGERIWRAEAESLTVCEECGRPGSPRRPGWILTLCNDHART